MMMNAHILSHNIIYHIFFNMIKEGGYTQKLLILKSLLVFIKLNKREYTMPYSKIIWIVHN